MKLKALFSVVIISFILACTRGVKPGDADSVARVGDDYLSRTELEKIIPPGLNGNDSTIFVRNYVDNWVRQKLVYNQAQLNIDETEAFERLVKEYRNSLIVYHYQQAVVEEKLDTIVPDNEIENYYQKHQKDFELKDNIVRIIYLKVPKKAPQLDKVKRWYKSSNEKDKDHLLEYANKYAVNSFLDEDTWLMFDDLLKEIPITLYNKEQFLKNNRFIEHSDRDYFYLINIIDFKIKSSISPLSFERDNIRSIIINRRKKKLIEDLENKVYLDAREKKLFDIYL